VTYTEKGLPKAFSKAQKNGDSKALALSCLDEALEGRQICNVD
jgi:hypothetical protein